MSSSSAPRTPPHQGQQLDLFDSEYADMALPASPYWDNQSDFSTHSSSRIAHRALVSTPRSTSPVTTAPATPFTSPIGPVNPAPLNPLPIDGEALLQEFFAARARLHEARVQSIQRQIHFIQELLELTEGMRQEVAVLLELSASMVEIDQKSIDDFHKQDMELDELEESDMESEESDMESKESDMELDELEESLASSLRVHEGHLAQMAAITEKIEQLRQELREAQGEAEELSQDLPLVGDQVEEVQVPAAEVAPPGLVDVEETIGELALNSPEHQPSATENIDQLMNAPPQTPSPAAAQHETVSPTTTVLIVSQHTQLQSKVNNDEIGEPNPIKKPELSHEVNLIAQLQGAGNVVIGKRKRDDDDEEVEGQDPHNVPNGWETRLRKRRKTDHSGPGINEVDRFEWC